VPEDERIQITDADALEDGLPARRDERLRLEQGQAQPDGRRGGAGGVRIDAFSAGNGGDVPVDATIPGDGYTNVLVGRTVNTKSCTYSVSMSFRNSVGPCLGELTATYKIRDEWRRQVNPAPATSSFPNDVPVGHPLHRFVEALASSGVTGGCGPGAFCPNDTITRGQMAVFPSAALGLNRGGLP
jgi:hypothetical protein